MKPAEIKVGGRYVAKVNGKLTVVRVDNIRESWHGKYCYSYAVTNTATGRGTTFHNARKFRREATVLEGRAYRPVRVPAAAVACAKSNILKPSAVLSPLSLLDSFLTNLS